VTQKTIETDKCMLLDIIHWIDWWTINHLQYILYHVFIVKTLFVHQLTTKPLWLVYLFVKRLSWSKKKDFLLLYEWSIRDCSSGDTKKRQRSAWLCSFAAHRQKHVGQRNVVRQDGPYIDQVLHVLAEVQLRSHLICFFFVSWFLNVLVSQCHSLVQLCV